MSSKETDNKKLVNEKNNQSNDNQNKENEKMSDKSNQSEKQKTKNAQNSMDKPTKDEDKITNKTAEGQNNDKKTTEENTNKKEPESENKDIGSDKKDKEQKNKEQETSEKKENKTDEKKETEMKEEKADTEKEVGKKEEKPDTEKEIAKEEEKADTEKEVEKEEKEEKKEEEKADTEKEEEKEEKKDKEEKPKKDNFFLRFLKKYKIPVIIAAAVIVLAAAITITIVVINAPKVFIREAEDFKQEISERKTVYVLKDDITVDGDLEISDALNIDLNKKTLEVKGSLVMDIEEEGEINIATTKSRGRISAEGEIIAEEVDIKAKNTSLNLYSPMTLSGSIEVKKLSVNEKVTVQDNESLELLNTEAEVNSGIEGTLRLTLSELNLNKEASITDIEADSYSDAVIYGKVTNGISGGNEISLLKYAECFAVENIESLYLQQETVNLGEATEIGEIIIVNQLQAPEEINIERTGTSFRCVAALVNNADVYIFTVKDEDGIIKTIPSETNECDITEYIEEPKTYQISVKASSENERINLPSEEITIEYDYRIQLEKPEIDLTETDEGAVILSFPEVDFAKVYEININGNEIEREKTDIDITEYVEDVGTYYIKVTATNPDNDAFTDSDVVLTSYIKNKELDAPDIEVERDGEQIIVSWEEVNNAKNYVLSYDETKNITTDTTMSLPLESISDGEEISVYAQGIGYYLTSDKDSITYEYPGLEDVSLPTYDINDEIVTISTDSVADATEYNLYKGNEIIQSGSSPTFEIDVADISSGDSFKIEAKADYYKKSVSEEITVTL